MGKRVAIVGTAESWKDCPWNDPTLEIWGLNDAYTLGFPRVDRWFELHPLDRMHFRDPRQRVVYEHEVPFGCFVRPQGHLETLQQMAKTIPVYLQQAPPPGWPPNAKRFPLEQMREAFGEYWASGPSYEVALAIMEGATEIQVWGIHLATDGEYRDQRPNFEHLLGIARGKGIKVVMADKSPVLKHGWRYAYEPKPQAHPSKVKLLETRYQKQELANQIVSRGDRASLRDRMKRLEAQEMDCLQRMAHRDPVKIIIPVIGVA